MTVIVYRDGIMAADTGVWEGDILCGFDQEKIQRMPDGGLLACAGLRPVIVEAQAWLLRDGPKPDRVEDGDFGALMVGPDGVVSNVSHAMQIYEAFGEFHVQASHHEFLVGALAAGVSAPEAVRLAIQFGRYAAGEVRWMRLEC